MTSDEAVTKIMTTCPGLSKGDVLGLLACSGAELTALVESYRHDGSALNTPTRWGIFFECLEACAVECIELAPIPGPLKLAVTKVFNLAEGAL